MTEQTSEERDLCSIVVRGDMNPKIHHPSWYKQIGCLTEDEQHAAENVVCTAPFAQFSIAAIGIGCATSRWEIQARTPDSLNRMLDIAVSVFDALDQTPVQSFGFNFNFDRLTAIPDVAEYLGDRVASLELGLPTDGKRSAEIKASGSLTDRHVNITLNPSSTSPRAIYVGVNYHYNISEIVGPPAHFDLGQLLRPRFATNQKDAVARLSIILQAITRASKVNHATSS